MSRFNFKSAASRSSLGPAPKLSKTVFEDSDDESGDERVAAAKSDSEEDPLDAFMAGIDQEVEANKATEGQEKHKGVRGDIDELDDQEKFFAKMEAQLDRSEPASTQAPLEEFDADGRLITDRHFVSGADPLGPIDHSLIKYQPFTKNVYEEHPDIASMQSKEVSALRRQLGLQVSGPGCPAPCTSFPYFGFDERLLRLIQKAEFTTPTPIQAQAVPAAMSGRDVIGIAQTGSGKTAAYVWPMISHILSQPPLQPDEGPIAIILAPTRELCLQIGTACRRYAKAFDLVCVTVYGGGPRYEQGRALEDGCEIVVATPGRLLDLLKDKKSNLLRTTFLVLDEADRMFDLGFEAQVNSLITHIRPDRQSLLFTATFKKRVEKLAQRCLTDPVRIVVGNVGDANSDIEQIVEMFPLESMKYSWLKSKIVELTAAGSVLIFVTRKEASEALHAELNAAGHKALLIHGDVDQYTRNQVLSQFRKQEANILVATDVAARGLDIPSVRTVVNYSIARDIDTHTHRIGRTGRAGLKGTAYTLLLNTDSAFAAKLVRNLESGGQPVSDTLLFLASKDSKFSQSHSFGRGRGSSGSSMDGSSGGGFSRRGRGGGRGGSMSNPGSKGKRRAGIGFVSSSSHASSSSLSSFVPATSSSREEAKQRMQMSFHKARETTNNVAPKHEQQQEQHASQQAPPPPLPPPPSQPAPQQSTPTKPRRRRGFDQ
eukprot:m.91339 g.91339  ORF g.91339 m.91339 type:complete len:713 (-) comp12943_c0_seq3:57-2195(-)